jgi:hypothetical protein
MKRMNVLTRTMIALTGLMAITVLAAERALHEL